MNPYFDRVLSENSLFAEAKVMEELGKSCIHIDRHVALPRPTEMQDVVQDACMAGFRLLIQWRQERESLVQSGLLISEPVLVIDDEWMSQVLEAPPPHVCITVAKTSDAFSPPCFVDHGGNDLDQFPLRGLLDQETAQCRVVRVRENPNPPYDKVGFWLVM